MDAKMMMYTVEDVAASLGVSVYTVRRMIRSGELPAVLFGRRGGYRISESDLKALLDRRKAATAVDAAIHSARSKL